MLLIKTRKHYRLLTILWRKERGLKTVNKYLSHNEGYKKEINRSTTGQCRNGPKWRQLAPRAVKRFRMKNARKRSLDFHPPCCADGSFHRQHVGRQSPKTPLQTHVGRVLNHSIITVGPYTIYVFRYVRRIRDRTVAFYIQLTISRMCRRKQNI